MKRAILVLILVIVGLSGFYVGKMEPKEATEYLEQNGYGFVQFTMVRLDSCGYGTPYRTGFSAINSKGLFVTGTVCRVFFGSPWIQLDW